MKTCKHDANSSLCTTSAVWTGAVMDLGVHNPFYMN